MTISYIGVGAVSSHADTITPAYPAGATVGRLAVLTVISGHPNESTPSTPSGWEAAGSVSGGGGVFGASAGPRRITYFVRVLTGGDAQPTTLIPTGGSGSLIAGRIAVLERSAGTGWRWATAFGEDTTSGTGFSAVSSTALTWTAGDFVILGYGITTSGLGTSAEAIAASGITFGTITERVDDGVAVGNTTRFALATGAVSSGSGSQAPTLSATLSGSSTGAAGVLRVREASSDVNATAQSVFPPRNLVSVTGLLADDITSVTVYRQVGTTLTAVRAASDVDTTGADVLLRVDAEQPFGVSLNYAATLTDVNGTQWTVYSGPITSTVDGDVVSDAIRGIGAIVKIEAPLEWKRSREASVFNVGGRLLAVGRPRSAPSTTFTVRTESEEEGDALDTVLDDVTEGILLIRKQVTIPRLDGHFALLEDTEAPTWYDAYRWWSLDVVKVEAWPDSLEAAGFTLQDIADNLSTLQDIATAFPGTLLDIALYDFG
ncbi:hypothetical protein STRCI_001260 [Streptomyces cinnabarinus]|uniref:Minor tail protein n=1 Tax=Streptomyces cinnabarinus TaxID=67287 RepID=A0ABY7K6M1_9ACTN|nr:hypothetical protein [Streptomyces cinnabarinus]WAZ20161.1 hypothetical protein STRCI_001260 [Streptomyces cinnabarinus]